jgi:ATP-dependent RNA helicase RhlE
MNSNFFGLGIAPGILEILQRLKFVTPTPIQQKAIPPAMEGKDIIGIAQTGTGKTLAFGIPLVQRLAGTKGKAVILAPTRELALQIDESLRRIIHHSTGLRAAVLIGGASMHNQVMAIRRNARIIIATPGRLLDHLEQRTIQLLDTKILVLDEADRMLDMGFAPQIEKILKQIPPERQTMLFSATMPSEIVRMARSHMQLPIQVEIAPPGTSAEKVTQELFFVRKEDKPKMLGKLLAQYHGTVLLFSRTKRGAAKITRGLRMMGHNAAEIHSDRSLAQRREALDGFKSGKYRILVATDIAARGIDVMGIELVINYDLPDDAENYVHRIGRTGRAGQEGHAISLATPDQKSDVRDIERLIRTALPVSKHPELSVEMFEPPPRPPTNHWSRRGFSSFGARRRRR